MLTKLITATAMLGGLLTASVGAYADPVSITVLRDAGDSGALTDSGSGSTSITGETLGTFNVSAQAIGSPILPQPDLDSSTIDVKDASTGKQTLYIWITETGITAPLGSFLLQSGFTSNVLTNASATETTFISTTDASYNAATNSFNGTEIASQAFSAIGTAAPIIDTPATTAAYSEAEEYAITFNVPSGGLGDANLTIDTTDVPEPASIALFGCALIGFGLFGRRRA